MYILIMPQSEQNVQRWYVLQTLFANDSMYYEIICFVIWYYKVSY